MHAQATMHDSLVEDECIKMLIRALTKLSDQGLLHEVRIHFLTLLLPRSSRVARCS